MTDSLPLAPLACPIDGTALKAYGSSYVCVNNHHFDVARQGYLNLLPVQFKPSQDPGDSKAMVLARRTVTDDGLFDELGGRIAAYAAELISRSDNQTSVLLDAGCGEGFFTHHMDEGIKATKGKLPQHTTIGIDISKWAIQAAARTYPKIAWAVANNKRPPVQTGSPALITSLFGFETWQPWSDIQVEGQYVLVVKAGLDHLLELRERIYDEVLKHEVSVPSDIQQWYTLVDQQPLTYVAPAVTGPIANAVLAMTPHGHRISNDSFELLKPTETVSLTIDVALQLFRRSSVLAS